jgi:hypothetical protein
MKVPAPEKPKKTRRNQPVVFKETLAPAAPSLPAAPVLPAITDRHMRYLLATVWIAATVLAGIGIGRLVAARVASAPALPGLPVARASVNVAPLAPADDSAVAVRSAAGTLTVTPSLAVKPSSATDQAAAGTPFQTAGTGWFQGAGPDLQPGFAAYGRVQGNIGTAPTF